MKGSQLTIAKVRTYLKIIENKWLEIRNIQEVSENCHYVQKISSNNRQYFCQSTGNLKVEKS